MPSPTQHFCSLIDNMKRIKHLAGFLPGMALFLLVPPARAQFPIVVAHAEVINRFKELQQELNAVSYPIDFDQLLLLVHRHTPTEFSFGSVPPARSEAPSIAFMMLHDMQATFLEDYLIEIVYQGSNPKEAKVIRARLCLRSKSGHVFYLDDREPSYFPIPAVSFPVRPANDPN